jgi:hypothetical protein
MTNENMAKEEVAGIYKTKKSLRNVQKDWGDDLHPASNTFSI